MALRLVALLFIRFPLVIVLSACASSPDDRSVQEARRIFATLADENRFSGAVILGRKGEIIFSEAFGAANEEFEFTLDTATDGASLAKPATALGVLVLVSEGVIDLDEKAKRYAPEFPHEETTVRQLLSHSAGLPDYDAFTSLFDSGAPNSNSILLSEITARGIAPKFPPGEKFAYCNICYDALALIIERTSGKTYEAFLQERLFAPVGVRSTFVRPARFADWPGPRTSAYRYVDGRRIIFDAFDNEGFYGGSNIYFSARDLHAWASAWATGAIPRHLRKTAVSPVKIGGRISGLTLGSWYCDKSRERCAYTGHHQGFHNFLYWDTERQATAVFVSNNTLPPSLQVRLARALVALTEGRTPDPILETSTAELDLNAAVGEYARDSTMQITVLAGSPASVRVDNGLEYAAFAVGDGMLYVPGLDAYLSFAERHDGRYLRMDWESVFAAFSARRI